MRRRPLNVEKGKQGFQRTSTAPEAPTAAPTPAAQTARTPWAERSAQNREREEVEDAYKAYVETKARNGRLMGRLITGKRRTSKAEVQAALQHWQEAAAAKAAAFERDPYWDRDDQEWSVSETIAGKTGFDDAYTRDRIARRQSVARNHTRIGETVDEIADVLADPQARRNLAIIGTAAATSAGGAAALNHFYGPSAVKWAAIGLGITSAFLRKDGVNRAKQAVKQIKDMWPGGTGKAPA